MAVIIYNPKCSEYGHGFSHPEVPVRVTKTAEFLKEKGCKFIEPEQASEKDLLLVHSQSLIDRIKSGEGSSDSPNKNGKMFEYAKLSAGAALEVLNHLDDTCFVLTRPPGHHAGRDFFGGFCYFNNIAIAVEKAKEEYNKIAIIDFDIHHGNGTQDIFCSDENVCYLSLHFSPFYPHTGTYSIGEHCINYLITNSSREDYMRKFDKVMKKIKKINPDLIAVSAGFDTYAGDLLSQVYLKKEDYSEIGETVASLEKPVFSVLEGGYSDDLPILISNYIQGLSE